MRCPYCITEIADEALVCPQCTRDLYLYKPLLEKIARLEQAIAAQAPSDRGAYETRIAALEEELAGLRAAPSAAIADVAPASADRWSYPRALLAALVPALILLIAAHGLLLFVYDVKPLYLRIASIMIPLPFAFLLAAHDQFRLWRSALAGFAMALLAVFSMMVVTATIDKVPVLPQDLREVRETFEYVASIGLAFLTGLLLSEIFAFHKRAEAQPHPVIVLVAKAFTANDKGEFGLEVMTKRVDKFFSAWKPAVAGAASVYAGVKALIGNMG